MYSVGKAPCAFGLGRTTGREPASCAGGRENSLALQVTVVSRLCLWNWEACYGEVLRCDGRGGWSDVVAP
jgi:hypothetical protein